MCAKAAKSKIGLPHWVPHRGQWWGPQDTAWRRAEGWQGARAERLRSPPGGPWEQEVIMAGSCLKDSCDRCRVHQEGIQVKQQPGRNAPLSLPPLPSVGLRGGAGASPGWGLVTGCRRRNQGTGGEEVGLAWGVLWFCRLQSLKAKGEPWAPSLAALDPRRGLGQRKRSGGPSAHVVTSDGGMRFLQEGAPGRERAVSCLSSRPTGRCQVLPPQHLLCMDTEMLAPGSL